MSIYYVNPDFLRTTNFNAKTTLKKIEPYRLKELIVEDLRAYPNSSISEIHKRIGNEINQRTLKTRIDKLVEEEVVVKSGKKRWTRYSINKNG